MGCMPNATDVGLETLDSVSRLTAALLSSFPGQMGRNVCARIDHGGFVGGTALCHYTKLLEGLNLTGRNSGGQTRTNFADKIQQSQKFR